MKILTQDHKIIVDTNHIELLSVGINLRRIEAIVDDRRVSLGTYTEAEANGIMYSIAADQEAYTMPLRLEQFKELHPSSF